AGTLSGTPTLTATDLGRSHFALDFATANTIKLVVTGAPAQLRWTGSDLTGNWDNQQTNPNWTRTDGGVTDPTHFYDGDIVTFNDNNSGHYTVNVVNTVQPGGSQITVDNSGGNYTFQGGGIIGGTSSLVKSGTSALIINNAGGGNTYSGGTFLNVG